MGRVHHEILTDTELQDIVDVCDALPRYESWRTQQGETDMSYKLEITKQRTGEIVYTHMGFDEFDITVGSADLNPVNIGLKYLDDRIARKQPEATAGLTTEGQHNEQRIDALIAAIHERRKAGKKPEPEWVDELASRLVNECHRDEKSKIKNCYSTR